MENFGSGGRDAHLHSIGPFDPWPIGMGFEYFYGFMGGDTNQWQPANPARKTTYICPFQGNPKFNLITATADEVIACMNQVNSLTPDQPFFVYYDPGRVHAPHHPTPEWIEKISDMLLDQAGRLPRRWRAPGRGHLPQRPRDRRRFYVITIEGRDKSVQGNSSSETSSAPAPVKDLK